MNKPGDVRIAIIGCGAVTELAHLPSIEKVPGCRVTLLVDTNQFRREDLASRFGVPHASAQWETHRNEFDAAIVALPHTLHERACCDLLRGSKAVLVEKPMATTVDEARRMLAVEQETGGLLAVGLMRHYQWSHRLARELIVGGTLGSIRTFDFREGSIYSWPVASDFFFRKDAAGGGVMMDTGAHTLDTLLWWLGEVESVDYRDDEDGGVEANCILELRMQSGATGVVELSRTRQLRNTARVVGENGSIEVGMGGNGITLHLGSSRYVVEGSAATADRPKGDSQQYMDLIIAQLADWTDAVRTGGKPAVSARETLASIQLMETCYKTRRPWLLPWAQVPPPEIP